MLQKTYYVRDNRRSPVMTVSIGKEGRTFARGISICSRKDVVKKSAGRAIAEGRVIQAFKNKKSVLTPIPKRIKNDCRLRGYFIWDLDFKKMDAKGIYRLSGRYSISAYKVVPTSFEKELLREKRRERDVSGRVPAAKKAKK